MTNPTYFARIGNEAEREMAHVLSSCHMRDDYRWEVILIEHGQVFMSWYENMGKESVEIPFSDFIRRFVPLSVIGSLAACHGATLLPNVKDLSHTIEWSDEMNDDEVINDNE